MKGLFKTELFSAGVFILLLAALMQGCSGSGKLVSPNACGMNVTLDELVTDCGKYNIFYSGDEKRPDAVLFDPKQDSKSIKTDYAWKPVDGAESLNQKIDSMRGDAEKPAELKAVQGSGNAVYGFVYTFGQNTVKQVKGNQDAVEVYPTIPEMKCGSGGGGGSG
jgi:hypothetical protein